MGVVNNGADGIYDTSIYIRGVGEDFFAGDAGAELDPGFGAVAASAAEVWGGGGAGAGVAAVFSADYADDGAADCGAVGHLDLDSFEAVPQVVVADQGADECQPPGLAANRTTADAGEGGGGVEGLGREVGDHSSVASLPEVVKGVH